MQETACTIIIVLLKWAAASFSICKTELIIQSCNIGCQWSLVSSIQAEDLNMATWCLCVLYCLNAIRDISLDLQLAVVCV